MNANSVNLILASQSPRRAALLSEAGFRFHILTPDDEVEEQAEKILPPEELVIHLARLKASNVVDKLISGKHLANLFPAIEVARDVIVVGADTVAHCCGEVLGKPVDREDARRMLSLMSGQEHFVLTGVSLWRVVIDTPHSTTAASTSHIEKLETTTVLMDRLSESQVNEFLATDGWRGKAGAFGYQDGLDWVHITDGLASNVVGLPVERLIDWISELGYVS